MKSNNILGIVFANTHDEFVKELSEERAMASLPFGGRYRMIDFTLSNLIHADVTKVGVITKSNYQSLMDHLGSGKPWDMARKNGGLYILPPYVSGDNGVYIGHIDALGGVMNFIENSAEEYVLLCDSDVISNLDLKQMIRYHEQKQADITIAGKQGIAPLGEDVMSLTADDDGRITEILVSPPAGEECSYSLDIVLIRRKLLISLIKNAMSHSYKRIACDLYQREVANLRMYRYQVSGYVRVIDSVRTYIKANMELLDTSVRNRLLRTDIPVLTKVRDEMPVRYGLNAQVKNSLVADGCIVDGNVENCILFRGVTVGKGTTVRNSILMQDCHIGAGVELDYILADKGVVISDGRKLSGTDTYHMYVRKESVV